MAHILLVDPNETARSALRGVLERGGHRFAATDNVTAAWDFILANVKVDLVIVELQLVGERGLTLIQQLKAHPLLKSLPVLVYTAQANRDGVKTCLDLHVQNFLVKPYVDEAVFAEIDKADSDPWRNRFFEEETSFCKMMGLTPDALHRQWAQVGAAIPAARRVLEEWRELCDPRAPLPTLATALQEDAEAAGVWGVVETLAAIEDLARAGDWSAFLKTLPALDFAADLIRHRLDPEGVPPGFQPPAEPEIEVVEAVPADGMAHWLNAPQEDRCPVVPWETLLQEVEGLPGCPVIDSAAAAFQMAANGHPSCINPLMDLVARDPGLSAQALIAAQKLRPAEEREFSCIEDARLAVGRLGEMRLAAESRKLLTVPQHVMERPPAFNWPQFWMFQRGVARIAQHTCNVLELYSMESVVRTAGELHDIGKLLLAGLHPQGFKAILEYSHTHHQSLPDTERLFLGGTTNRLGAHFADHFGLSRRYANVMRWIDTPDQATEDAQLVAVVALARELCHQNKVGHSGDSTAMIVRPIEETPAWTVLREAVFPSFNVREFEQQMHQRCAQLRAELSGHKAGTIASLAANLVTH